jgi:hypothetical protein
MKKKARINPATAKYIARILGGAAVGGAAGQYVTPELFGYKDVPEARRTSMLSDAALGAILGALGGPRKSPITAFKALPPAAKLSVPLGIPAAELGPMMIAKLTKEREAAEGMQNAAKTMAESSIPAALGRAAQSPISRGAGVGAAGAGMAALMSGLLRRRNEQEMKQRTGRGSMVGKDFMKYLLPAMVAGGVAGSFTNKQ